MSVTISYSKHITENFKTVKVPLNKICDLVKSEYNYSAGTFKNGYRKADNYQNYSDLIILDIDDGLTLNEAKDVFMQYDYIIATTKSHQKEKNGIICDRFRVILPTETPIILDKNDYSKMMEEVHKEFPFVDKVCKDASRFYFPSIDSQVFTHSGFCSFFWEEYYEKAKARYELDEDKKERLKNLRQTFSEKKDFEEIEKIDYIRKIAKTEKLLKLLKYDEKFISGQRNKTLFTYGKYFQDLGMTDDEIKDNLLWINNQGDSIPEDEIYKTLFKSLRVL